MLALESPSQEVPPVTPVDAIQVAGDDVELGIPDELQDAASDQYFDMALLREAWNQLDAAALAAARLQLAEGERILRRSRRAVTADQVLAANNKTRQLLTDWSKQQNSRKPNPQKSQGFPVRADLLYLERTLKC